MASDSKTEAPTQYKRQKTREEGRAAISRDLIAGISLLAVCIITRNVFPPALEGFQSATKLTWLACRPDETAALDAEGIAQLWIKAALRLAVPILLGSGLAGIFISLVQTKMAFSLTPLIPKFETLNPISGLRKVISVRGLVEALKGLIKVTLVGGCAIALLWSKREELWRLSDGDTLAGLKITAELLYALGLRCGISLAILGAFDYAYQWWEFEKSLRMSHQEVREENKQMEGDPRARSRRRSLRNNMLQQGISREMIQATAVVVNPTHIAVALRYEPGMTAPKIVAKGRFGLAQRIVAQARKQNTPVIRNIQLARNLYKFTSVGDYVPGAFYQAVAEVLAAIFRHARERRARQRSYYA